jgi:hypothetical protein
MENLVNESYLRRLPTKMDRAPMGASNIGAIGAVEVELWLRTLPLARGSRAKIRNLMSVLFNHARRHDFIDRNPISLVRQCAKRRTQPAVLLWRRREWPSFGLPSAYS